MVDKLAWPTPLAQPWLHPCRLKDANAAIGSICDDTTGPLNPEEEDINGAQLRLLAGQFGLFIPSTFEGIHSGPSPTWFSAAASTPTGTRNDFILVPRAWTAFSLSSSVLPDIDIAQSNVDHVALSLSVSGPTPAGPQPRRRTGQPKIDWQLVRKCKDHSVWAQIFKDLPQPSWYLDAHSHWQLCHEALCARLRVAFPQRKSQPKKPYTSLMRPGAFAIKNVHCDAGLLYVHICAPRLISLCHFRLGVLESHFEKLSSMDFVGFFVAKLLISVISLDFEIFKLNCAWLFTSNGTSSLRL